MKDLIPEYNIIDIREKSLYEKDHLFNSINIPMDNLLNNPSKYINKKDTYFIYCSSGIRSKKTCELYNLLSVISLTFLIILRKQK